MLNSSQIDAKANADAFATNAGLPAYSDLLAFAQRMAYPSAGELLILDDYRNIARNIVEPNGVRLA